MVLRCCNGDICAGQCMSTLRSFGAQNCHTVAMFLCEGIEKTGFFNIVSARNPVPGLPLCTFSLKVTAAPAWGTSDEALGWPFACMRAGTKGACASCAHGALYGHALVQPTLCNLHR